MPRYRISGLGQQQYSTVFTAPSGGNEAELAATLRAHGIGPEQLIKIPGKGYVVQGNLTLAQRQALAQALRASSPDTREVPSAFLRTQPTQAMSAITAEALVRREAGRF